MYTLLKLKFALHTKNGIVDRVTQSIPLFGTSLIPFMHIVRTSYSAVHSMTPILHGVSVTIIPVYNEQWFACMKCINEHGINTEYINEDHHCRP